MSEFIDGFIEKAKEGNNRIENELYSKYDVKKGLRNEDGTGVLVGLTKIADVVGYKKINGKKLIVMVNYIIVVSMFLILSIEENLTSDFYLKRLVF